MNQLTSSTINVSVVHLYPLPRREGSKERIIDWSCNSDSRRDDEDRTLGAAGTRPGWVS